MMAAQSNFEETPAVTHARDTLRAWLGGPRLEVAPGAGVVDRVISELPPASTVTVVSSQGRGLEPTLRMVEQLTGLGRLAVPHLVARMVRDGDHLAEVVRRLEENGVKEVFVVGGDSPRAAGPYASALDLLHAMEERGHRFARVGVAVYPEPHPSISAGVLQRALTEKAGHVTYAVSNLCFEAPMVVELVHRLRRSGFTLPLHLGVAGPISLLRLLRIARRIGVGESTHSLLDDARGAGGTAARVRYRPEPFLRDLATSLAEPSLGIGNIQLSTFNDVVTTERWRRRLIATGFSGEAGTTPP